MYPIQMYPFKNSSQAARYGYDPTRSVLVVEFPGAKGASPSTYEYPNVTVAQFADMDKAPFTGKHFSRTIRNNADHPARKVIPEIQVLPGAHMIDALDDVEFHSHG